MCLEFLFFSVIGREMCSSLVTEVILYSALIVEHQVSISLAEARGL